MTSSLSLPHPLPPSTNFSRPHSNHPHPPPIPPPPSTTPPPPPLPPLPIATTIPTVTSSSSDLAPPFPLPAGGGGSNGVSAVSGPGPASASMASSTSVAASGPSEFHVTIPPAPSFLKPWKPKSVKSFTQQGLLGEGTYGSVFRARAAYATELCALKKIRKEKKEGFPLTAIREIKILRFLDHPNIVKLKDVVSSNEEGKEGDVYMVFEFCDHDLMGIMEANLRIGQAQIKYYMKCIMEGLNYIHANKIIHRDIKGANVLISNNGDVKLADFGLARCENQSGEYTNRVVTLWYRAPELLLGLTKYSNKIDMWSAGCLFGELLDQGRPLFPGDNTEMDQLTKIFEVCGTPTKEDWPNARMLKNWREPTPRRRVLKEKFKLLQCSPQAIDLLDKLLCLNPDKRLSAKEALDHPYFWTEPLPMKPHMHPRYGKNFHEYHSKRRKENRVRLQQQQEREEAERKYHKSMGYPGHGAHQGQGAHGQRYPPSHNQQPPAPLHYSRTRQSVPYPTLRYDGQERGGERGGERGRPERLERGERGGGSNSDSRLKSHDDKSQQLLPPPPQQPHHGHKRRRKEISSSNNSNGGGSEVVPKKELGARMDSAMKKLRDKQKEKERRKHGSIPAHKRKTYPHQQHGGHHPSSKHTHHSGGQSKRAHFSIDPNQKGGNQHHIIDSPTKPESGSSSSSAPVYLLQQHPEQEQLHQQEQQQQTQPSQLLEPPSLESQQQNSIPYELKYESGTEHPDFLPQDQPLPSSMYEVDAQLAALGNHGGNGDVGFHDMLATGDRQGSSGVDSSLQHYYNHPAGEGSYGASFYSTFPQGGPGQFENSLDNSANDLSSVLDPILLPKFDSSQMDSSAYTHAATQTDPS